MFRDVRTSALGEIELSSIPLSASLKVEEINEGTAATLVITGIFSGRSNAGRRIEEGASLRIDPQCRDIISRSKWNESSYLAILINVEEKKSCLILAPGRECSNENPPLLELLQSIFAAFPVFVPESRGDTCCNCFNNTRRITAFEIIKSTILYRG